MNYDDDRSLIVHLIDSKGKNVKLKHVKAVIETQTEIEYNTK